MAKTFLKSELMIHQSLLSTSNIATQLTNQVNNQSIIPSTDVIQLTLTLKVTSTTLLFRTILTRTIIFSLLGYETLFFAVARKSTAFGLSWRYFEICTPGIAQPLRWYAWCCLIRQSQRQICLCGQESATSGRTMFRKS